MRSAFSERWVVASRNRGKVAELEALLAGTGIGLSSVAEFTSTEPAETGTTFVENALIKARHAARASGLTALADDSGIMVDALDGAPGVRSARFAGHGGSDAGNVAKLLDALAGTPTDGRGAAFHCVLVVLRHPGDPAPLIAEGTWRGQIAAAPAGTGGFGYDPVFYDPVARSTAAELSTAAKNAASHRAKAVERLRALLEGLR